MQALYQWYLAGASLGDIEAEFPVLFRKQIGWHDHDAAEITHGWFLSRRLEFRQKFSAFFKGLGVSPLVNGADQPLKIPEVILYRRFVFLPGFPDDS